MELYNHYSQDSEETIESPDTIDSKLDDAIKVVMEAGKAATYILQRYLKVGYGRAERMLDQMEKLGIIGPSCGPKPRSVLMTYEQWIESSEEKFSSLQSTDFLKSDNLSLDDIPDVITPDMLKNQATSYMESLGITVDFSNDGYFTKKLDNYIFSDVDDEMQIKFITNAVTYASPNKLGLILIDESVGCFNVFQRSPSLLVPIISEPKKAEGAFSWLCHEAERRCLLLAERGVRNIFEYNELIEHAKNEPAVEELPHILFVVNEAYHLLNNPSIDPSFISLLLKSKKVGIYLYLFSRFTLKSLSLGIKADLLKPGNPIDLERIFLKTHEESRLITIEDLDSNMNGYDFEEFCGNLLHKNGFTNITVTQSSGDFGVDIIAFKDEIKYAIQCKKYSSPVGIDAVQQILGSKTMFNCHVGVVLTNNYFTPAALELAEKNNILMWDRNKLIKLIEATR